MKYLFALLIFILSLPVTAQQQLPDNLKIYDIRPNNLGAIPCFFTEFKGKLYFAANDDAHGYELWSVDKSGVAKMVYDLNPGTASGAYYKDMNPVYNTLSSDIRHMAVLWDDLGKEKMLYFQGDNGKTGWELFKYDGVTAPALAYEFKPGAAAISGQMLFKGAVAVNNKVYFAIPETNDWSVKEYDAGTNTAKSIHFSASEIQKFTVYNGNTYFSSRDSLLCYNASTGITITVANYANNGPMIEYMHVVSGKLYFGMATANGKLYEYDGNSKPVSVANYDVLCNNSYRYPQWTIGEYNGKVYFPCADKGVCQACEFDPVSKNVKALGGGSSPDCFASCNGILYYAGYDSHDYEIWSYNGVNPPKLEVDIDNNKGWSRPRYLTAYNNELYFAAQYNTKGYELMKYTPRGKWSSSISNVFFTGEITVYPNPVIDVCNVELKLKEADVITVQLYDATGKLVRAKAPANYPAGESKIQFDMKALTAGVYYVKLVDNKGSMLYKGKVVKE